mmetsp:Transcript_49498/g.161011  ORF Transcript_49498/g.161011 Transcript_49498/m.161011 type:complete len:212 (-) Transcript_49498:657-1292(-)
MAPRSAGNPNMGGQIDASGSHMGAVVQWFRSGGENFGKARETPGEKKAARLRVSGLGPEVTEADVKAYFSRYYSTVDDVRLQPPGEAFVLFRFAGECDKALHEAHGRKLGGYTMSLSKSTIAAPADNAQDKPRPPPRPPPRPSPLAKPPGPGSEPSRAERGTKRRGRGSSPPGFSSRRRPPALASSRRRQPWWSLRCSLAGGRPRGWWRGS